MLEQAVAIKAGLEADPTLVPLAKLWLDRKVHLRKERDLRDDDRWAHAAASRAVNVNQVHWRGAVVAVSGVAYLASGKAAKAAPYSVLLGSIPAATAIKYGASNAVAFTDKLLAKAEELKVAILAAALAALKAAATLLGAADLVRTVARNKSISHEAIRVNEVAAFDKLVGETEAAILVKHPSNKDLVRAVLAWPVREKADKHPLLPV
ncbi:MAG: hypothetical protein EXR77_12460 [Myxococcales bacterium]|nr:hypothetical protein [Myxococcales bacterium]